jgi:hypothetical protein
MTRRTTVIVLSLLGLMVLVVTFAPTQTPVQSDTQPTPVASAPPADLTDPDAFDVSQTLSAAPGAKAETIVAELGDRVEIVVEGDKPDSVQLGALSLHTVEAGAPARFELLAETAGAYPLVLVNENRRIGTLDIR